LSKVVGVLRRDLVDVARAAPNADLYYLHSHQPYPGVAWRRRWHGASLVYDAHDFYDELMRPGLGGAAKRYWQRHAIRAAAAFVTVSEGVADLYERAYGRRPTVIRNAHDARIETAVTAGLRQHIQLGPEVRLFAVVGNAKPHMATEQVVDALAALPPDVHVAFVGRGHRERLFERIPVSLATRVHVIGAVEPTEVVPFIASADAAFVPYVATEPNTRYSLQNGFFQSVAAGLPLVVPEDLPELRTLAGPAGVAVDFADTQSIVRGARELLEDDAGSSVARAAVNKLREHLTWEREESHLLDVVATALDDRRSRRSRRTR
jgi:glycosyltransferase involved in cell wall biosynthesis